MHADRLSLAELLAPSPEELSVRRELVERYLIRDEPGAAFGYGTGTIARYTADLLRPPDEATTAGDATIGAFVLKMVADCNFRCTYPCYEYVDDTWQNVPPVMPEAVVKKVGHRIGEYALTSGRQEVAIIFHGGEPLYMHRPEEYYKRIIPLLLRSIDAEAPGTNVTLDMQTNGVLLRPPILDVLKEYNVGVGVSLDGPAAAHDARRLTKNGARGTHQLVMRGLGQLSRPEYSHLARSLLCVINIDSDPLEVDDVLRNAAPPGTKYIDYILPYATHDIPPPQPQNPDRQSETPYADWLLSIFWRSLRGKAPHVRLFNSIMQLKLGGHSSTEAIGPDAGSEMVLRTDGSYELLDALKADAPGITVTNMGVDTHSIEEVAEMLRGIGHLGKKTVAAVCAPCPVFAVCGGGHIANRYSAKRGFDNESVYCKDLELLTREIAHAAEHHTYSQVAQLMRSRGVPQQDTSCC